MRFTDPSAHWEKYGQMDPYYGVATSDEYRRENLTPEALEKFYGTGEKHLDWLFGYLPKLSLGTALDFGCGVGRVLIPLAGRFRTVTGVDVSPSMLEECRRSCDVRGIGNVTLTSEIPAQKFDLVHSSIVLQHIPLAEGYRIIHRLSDSVAAGGVGALHVSLSANEVRARAFFWVTKNIPLSVNFWNLTRRRSWDYPHMEANVYRVEKILKMLSGQGVPSAQVIYLPASQPMRSNSAMIIFTGPRSQELPWTPWTPEPGGADAGATRSGQG